MIPTAFRHSKFERIRPATARGIEAAYFDTKEVPDLDGDGSGKACGRGGVQFGHQFADGLLLLLV
jgi:hypothetical protein